MKIKENNKENAIINIKGIEKVLFAHDIPFLFTSEEFYNNKNPDFLFLQLYIIYTHLKTEDSRKKTGVSTNTSSKSSKNFFDYSFTNDSPLNLESMEKKVAHEERKFMFISDIRMKKENITKPNQLIVVPSVKEIPHCSSQHILSQNEMLICFLLTPRILQIMIGGELKRVLLNVLPDESKFCLKHERYILECKELASMKIVFLCEIEEIEEMTFKPPGFILWVHKQPIKIICKSSEECQKYYEGLEYLLSTY